MSWMEEAPLLSEREDDAPAEAVSKKVRARPREGTRLDAAAWTAEALSLLALHGIDGVRVEVLAKRLNVTKGSFYWHFRDRDQLFEGMLSAWRRQATIELMERLDRTGRTPGQRLEQLLRLPITGRRSARAADVELAIRLWGRRDPRAAAALAEVDQLRLHYIAKLFVQAGIPAEEADARAVIAYSYMRVAPTMIAANDAAMMALCEGILIGTKG